jgi:hypothetical protein
MNQPVQEKLRRLVFIINIVETKLERLRINMPIE